jgi:[pyruvate, water dikinase]-phosphate phosphotransferase / [pyruvate, water dikinase] kinase
MVDERRQSVRDPQTLTVMVLTGGTGRTADQVLRAALAQFTKPAVEVVRKTQLRRVGEARQAVETAEMTHAVICHTLVDPRIRDAVIHESERRGVPTVDLLGPLLNLLDDHLPGPPQLRPGLCYELNKEYFDRIDAVDFTLAHDDGARPEGLGSADVVLVGVSRVAKSVTCSYLANRGVRAANVPLVPGCPIPWQLTELDPRRVFGLTMNVHRLRSVREARVERMRVGAVQPYVTLADITTELRFAEHLCRDHGWRSVDVSYKAVEEVAYEILRLLDAVTREERTD